MENHVVVNIKLLYSSAELEQSVCALSALAAVLLMNPHEPQMQLKFCKVPLPWLNLRQRMQI